MNVLSLGILCGAVMALLVILFGKAALLGWAVAVLIAIGLLLSVTPWGRED